MFRKKHIFAKYDGAQQARVLTKERQVIHMKLKPLGDKVVLQYQDVEEKTESGIILPDSAKEKSQEAVVIAVGPGKCKDGQKVPMQVKEGDKVIISEYGGTEVKIGDEEYKIVSQDDILAIVEK